MNNVHDLLFEIKASQVKHRNSILHERDHRHIEGIPAGSEGKQKSRIGHCSECRRFFLPQGGRQDAHY